MPVNADDEFLEQVQNRNQQMLINEAYARAAIPAPEPEEEEALVEPVEGEGDDDGLNLGLPGTVARGGIEAVNETLDMARNVASMLPDLGGIQIRDPETGDFGLRYVSDSSELSGFVVPQPFAAPDTVAGEMVQSVSKFLAGYATGGKILKNFGVLQGAISTGAQISKAMIQGAMADFAVFDEHEARLSDLIESVPMLRNPITGYLASDPDDSWAEGRFKNMMEGLGFGVMTDSVLQGLRAIRAARNARQIFNDEYAPRLGKDEIEAAIGDPAKPLVMRRGGTTTPENVLKDPGDGDLFINWSRIDSADDVKGVMQRMADTFSPENMAARRGGEKRGFREIELDAEQMNAWQILSERRRGQPLGDAEALAARNLWAHSAQRLTDSAKTAANNPTPANLVAFRKLVNVHRTIQSEVMAARTETARALSSWRIPAAGEGQELVMRHFQDMLDQAGGADLAADMAKRIARLDGAGLELDSVIEKGYAATTKDAFIEAWINGLLSGPKTHLVNMLSNTGVIFLQMQERAIAGQTAKLLGDQQSVALGEATAQWTGLINSTRDALRFARKSWMTGESGYGLGKVELPAERALSASRFNLPEDSIAGRIVSGIGSLVNVPSRALQAEDEFFKTIGYRMELHAQAVRQASYEVNQGLIKQADFKTRMQDIIDNPPNNIHLRSIDAATYQTFTNAPGEIAKALSRMSNRHAPLKMIFPFVRTPANLMRFAFERSPIAPLFKQTRQDLAAGGARHELAMTRMATGTAIMSMFADMAMNDRLTGKGPVDPAERQVLLRQGWQPYSIRIGDRFYSYSRVDPLGMSMGMAADITDILAEDDYGAETDLSMEETVIAGTMAIANNALSKTYLSGLSDIVEAMSDPARYGESYAQRLAGSLVPTGVAEITRWKDPYMREAQSMVEAMQRRTPGLSEELPFRRDLWGRQIGYRSGIGPLYDMVSPIYSKKLDPEPVDAEIMRLEATVKPIRRKVTFPVPGQSGVEINFENYPKAFERYVQLAGNEAKHPAWQLGAMDFLNQVVGGEHPISAVYWHPVMTDGYDGKRAEFIQSTVNDYRKIARRQILQEFPEIKAEYDELVKARRDAQIEALTEASQ